MENKECNVQVYEIQGGRHIIELNLMKFMEPGSEQFCIIVLIVMIVYTKECI